MQSSSQNIVKEWDKVGGGATEAHHVTPWVSAEELQPAQRPQSSAPLDDLDEALMESFPCSDPPCYGHAHA